MTHLIYLHGFLSSPLSSKAVATQSWLGKHRPDWQFHCPPLSSYPDIAISQIAKLLGELGDQPKAFIGSSLGGFWATGFAEQWQIPTVLINPAVAPQTRFHQFVGQNLANFYSNEQYRLEDRHLQQLIEFDQPALKFPQNYWLMVQTGDETLDYRLALDKYAACKITLEPGGNHSFAGYETWLPQIMQFIDSRLTGQ